MPSERGDRALLSRSAAVRLVLALPPLWFTAGVLLLHVQPGLKLLVGIVAALTLVSPAGGLLAVMVVAPFGSVIEHLAGWQPFRVTEAIVLAFLGVWLLRAARDRFGPRVPRVTAAAGWLLALAIAASVGMLAWRDPGAQTSLARWLLQAYYLPLDRIGFVDGARMLEGLGLVAATLWALRQRPRLADRLPLALCAAGAVAAVMGYLIARGAGGPALIDWRYYKFRATPVTDPNAAGSYFAMTLCISAGMAVRRQGWRRALWLTLAAINAAGLQWSGSLSALGAAGLMLSLAALWSIVHQRSLRVRVAASVALVALLALGGVGVGRFWRHRILTSATFRREFNEASLRMIAARPLGGVGIGQYHAASPLFFGSELVWSYGAENAHDYFLQLAAELGVPGLVLFAAWLGAAGAVVAHAIIRRPDPRLLGLSAGAAAFLVTCGTGHPLLVDEVAAAFWPAAALALGLAESALMNAGAADAAVRPTPRTHLIWLAAAAATLLVLSLANARRGPVGPSSDRAVTGLYGWEQAEDGRPFRWTMGTASLFVPAEARHVSIPARLPIDERAVSPSGVRVMVDGRILAHALVGASWVMLEVPLPAPRPGTRFARINLKVDRTWQPAIYVAGSADMRALGIQLGVPRTEGRW